MRDASQRIRWNRPTAGRGPAVPRPSCPADRAPNRLSRTACHARTRPFPSATPSTPSHRHLPRPDPSSRRRPLIGWRVRLPPTLGKFTLDASLAERLTSAGTLANELYSDPFFVNRSDAPLRALLQRFVDALQQPQRPPDSSSRLTSRRLEARECQPERPAPRQGVQAELTGLTLDSSRTILGHVRTTAPRPGSRISAECVRMTTRAVSKSLRTKSRPSSSQSA